MHRTVLGLAASMLLVGGLVTPLLGQSLADLAKQEEERRKAIARPAKVITNKDLVPVLPPSTAPPLSATPQSGPAADAAKGGDKQTAVDSTSKTAEPGKDQAVRDQAYWSGRLTELQVQLDRDQTYAEALQTRINALAADFVNRDDPAQRALIERDRQKALVELDRLKLALERGKKAIADFQEEARRAGVPPGWLR